MVGRSGWPGLGWRQGAGWKDAEGEWGGWGEGVIRGSSSWAEGTWEEGGARCGKEFAESSGEKAESIVSHIPGVRGLRGCQRRHLGGEQEGGLIWAGDGTQGPSKWALQLRTS